MTAPVVIRNAKHYGLNATNHRSSPELQPLKQASGTLPHHGYPKSRSLKRVILATGVTYNCNCPQILQQAFERVIEWVRELGFLVLTLIPSI